MAEVEDVVEAANDGKKFNQEKFLRRQEILSNAAFL